MKQKKRFRKLIAILTLLLCLQLLGGNGSVFFNEILFAQTRSTYYIPNSTYTNINPAYTGGGLFSIPTASNDLPGNANGNNYLQMTQSVADQSIANSNITFDLMNNDFELQLNMSFGTTYGDANFQNRGMAVVFSTAAVTSAPGGNLNGDYSRLGVYGQSGTNGGPALPNALAIEFDLANTGSNADINGAWYDGTGSVSGPHIAITKPITPTSTTTITHNATTSYAGLNNGAYHRVVINWKLIAPDQYQLTYKVYATATPAAGEAPMATSSLTLTKAQALTYFGTETNFQNLRLSLTAGGAYDTGSVNDMFIAFPTLYGYTEYFYLKDYLTGNVTTTPVPGLVTDFPTAGGTTNPVTGSFPTGDHDFGPLPAAPAGYKISPGQTTVKYISSTPTSNVYTFYYEIDTTQTLPYTIEYYHDGNLMSTVSKSVLVAIPKVTSVDISNQPAGTQLLRYEFPAGTTVSAPSGTPLVGVEYTLTQTASYDVTTDTWTAVTGATPFTMTTGTGGTVSQQLAAGRYTMQETSVPVGYNGDSTIFTVELPMTSADGSTLMYDVYIYPKNELIRGAIHFTQYGDDEITALPGGTYTLVQVLDKDGTTVNNVISTTLTPGSDGTFSVNDLPYGSYTLTQTAAPTGYTLNPTVIEFDITESGNVAADGTQTGTIVSLSQINYLKPVVSKDANNVAGVDPAGTDAYNVTGYNVSFPYHVKVALPGDADLYTQFELTDQLNSKLTLDTTTTPTVTVGGVTVSTGYTLTTTNNTVTLTVTDYTILTPGEELVITFNASFNTTATSGDVVGNTANLTYTNSYDSPDTTAAATIYVKLVTGSIAIYKYDSDTTAALQGAEFALMESDGVTAVLDKNGTAYTGATDINGDLLFSDVPFGDYKLIETKAPNGYKIYPRAISVSVTAAASAVDVDVPNSLNQWSLPQTGGMGSLLFTALGVGIMGFAYKNIRKKDAAKKA